jgi:SAM-dependent methyltransferase
MIFQCLLCSTPTLRIIENFATLPRVTSDARPFSSGGTLAACRECGAIQKIPDETFVDEVQQIYATYDLYKHADGTEQTIFVDGKPRKRSELLFDLLKQHAKLDRLIDVGCGNGAALRTVSSRRPHTKLWGAELSDRTAAALRAIPNFQKLFTGPLSTIDAQFDTLTTIHVLEHVFEPVDFLEECATLLDRDGLMLVEVPDVETSPFDLVIADHLTHFSVSTLEYAMSQAGLRLSLLSNQIIRKEVTAIATRAVPPCEVKRPLSRDGFERAQTTVNWLSDVLAHAQATPTDLPLGVFGTSMAGMWLYGAMKDRVRFFVDEDDAKIGNQIDGHPILHPMAVPKSVRVLVPLPQETSIQVARRWTSPEREYVALGSARIETY